MPPDRRIPIAYAIALVAWCTPTSAQTYPSRSITVIVPFPAGGPSDVVARIVADQMGKLLGQTWSSRMSAAPAAPSAAGASLRPRRTATPCWPEAWARMWRRPC